MSSATCLKVSAREDGRDGDGNYKMVFKLQHTGHQSYEQRFAAEFSEDFSVVEVPGDVQAEVVGRELRVQRKNQLNDNGLTEIWVKIASSGQPKVTALRDFACRQEENEE